MPHFPILEFPRSLLNSTKQKPSLTKGDKNQMNTNLQTLALPAAIAASLLSGCSSDKIVDRTDPNRPSIVQVQDGFDTFGRKWSSDAPLTRNDYMLLTYTGTITDIDYTTREITMKSADGRMQSFIVDDNVKRLNEVKVGDKLSLDYYLGMNAEIRQPTAEEQQNPLVILAADSKAGPDAPPAAHSWRRVRALVTIEAMDRAAQTVTVKGPRGRYFTTRVADPSRFDQVQVGDTIVLVFTEASAISLKPAESEAAK